MHAGAAEERPPTSERMVKVTAGKTALVIQ